MRRLSALTAALALAHCSFITLAYLLARMHLHWAAKYEVKAPMVSQAQGRFGLLLFAAPLVWCWLAMRREGEPGSSGPGTALIGVGVGLTLVLGALVVLDVLLLFRGS